VPGTVSSGPLSASRRRFAGFAYVDELPGVVDLIGRYFQLAAKLHASALRGRHSGAPQPSRSNFHTINWLRINPCLTLFQTSSRHRYAYCSRSLNIAAITRGLRRPWKTATHSGFLSGA
jgi:hypothetical protein